MLEQIKQNGILYQSIEKRRELLLDEIINEELSSLISISLIGTFGIMSITRLVLYIYNIAIFLSFLSNVSEA